MGTCAWFDWRSISLQTMSVVLISSPKAYVSKLGTTMPSCELIIVSCQVTQCMTFLNTVEALGNLVTQLWSYGVIVGIANYTNSKREKNTHKGVHTLYWILDIVFSLKNALRSVSGATHLCALRTSCILPDVKFKYSFEKCLVGWTLAPGVFPGEMLLHVRVQLTNEQFFKYMATSI